MLDARHGITSSRPDEPLAPKPGRAEIYTGYSLSSPMLLLSQNMLTTINLSIGFDFNFSVANNCLDSTIQNIPAWKAAQWKRSPQMRKCRGRSKVWVLKSSPRTDAIPVQATKNMTQGRKKRQLIDGGSQGGGIAPSAILGGGKPLQIYAGVMCRTRFQGTGQPKAVSLFRTENMYKGPTLQKSLCHIY